MEFLYNLLIIPIISLINWLFLASLWITGSYGWAVILLSIIVKVLLLPVGLLVERLKKEELLLQQVIQPIIKDLKYKYKGEELHNKISKLYKQYSYNPIYSLKTSLGLFIQLPFFIGAFIYFGENDELKDISFSVIKSLAEPDRIFLLGEININVLPIIMTLISFGATYLYGLRYNALQTNQLYALALLFLLLLYNEPSSLLIYWTTNNIFSFIEAFIAERSQIFSTTTG